MGPYSEMRLQVKVPGGSGEYVQQDQGTERWLTVEIRGRSLSIDPFWRTGIPVSWARFKGRLVREARALALELARRAKSDPTFFGVRERS